MTSDRTTTRRTIFFADVLLLVGFANLLAFSGNSELESLMTEANYLIYIGLLLFWLRSVRARLLPSRTVIEFSELSLRLRIPLSNVQQ